jgi:hypothetical protein
MVVRRRRLAAIQSRAGRVGEPRHHASGRVTQHRRWYSTPRPGHPPVLELDVGCAPGAVVPAPQRCSRSRRARGWFPSAAPPTADTPGRRWTAAIQRETLHQ